MTASLRALTIGTLSLSPAFAPDQLTYTATTTNATNKITATPQRADAMVEIRSGSTVITNGSSITWATGANIVTVKVTCGTTSQTYTITVTKS